MAITTLLETVSDYITDTRVILQDRIAPYRYTDDELLVAFYTALAEGRRLRPDLFVFTGDGTVPKFTLVDGTAVDIEDPFRTAFVYGAAGHALMRDQEDVQDKRSTAFIGLFQQSLIGVALPPVEGGQPQGGG